MPILACSECGKKQRLDDGEFVACRYCTSSNLRPVDDASSNLQPVDG